MSNEFPVLLAYAFVASFLMTVLKTSRWKILLLSVVVVWCVRIGPTEINLLSTGTVQAYAWFGLLCVASWLPALAVSLIGTDLGARLLSVLPSAQVDPESSEADAAAEGQNEEASE